MSTNKIISLLNKLSAEKGVDGEKYDCYETELETIEWTLSGDNGLIGVVLHLTPYTADKDLTAWFDSNMDTFRDEYCSAHQLTSELYSLYAKEFPEVIQANSPSLINSQILEDVEQVLAFINSSLEIK